MKSIIHKNLKGLIKSKLRLALAKMSRKRASGSKEMIMEILSAFNDLGVNKVMEMVNELFNSSKNTGRPLVIFLLTDLKETRSKLMQTVLESQLDEPLQ